MLQHGLAITEVSTLQASRACMVGGCARQSPSSSGREGRIAAAVSSVALTRAERGDKQSHCPRQLEAGVERTLFEAERVEAEEQQWDGA